jgi:hypothetical protein
MGANPRRLRECGGALTSFEVEQNLQTMKRIAIVRSYDINSFEVSGARVNFADQAQSPEPRAQSPEPEAQSQRVAPRAQSLKPGASV